jgi:hypothetical protein
MKKALVLLAGLALFASPAMADDVFAPVWRGEDNTVFAEWNTWNGFNTVPTPFLADTSQSVPAGLPAADAQAYDTAQYLPTHESRSDVVEINGFAQIDFLMPNFAGQAFTELWIQLTYWAQDPTAVTFLIDTDPYTDDINGPQFEGSFDHAGGWVTTAYSFTILPSVDFELVTLDFANAANNPVYLDHVVIESVAAPEPAAFGLAALLIALARRR